MNINPCIFRHLRWQRFHLMLWVVSTWMAAGLHSYAQVVPIHISSYTKGPYRQSACSGDVRGFQFTGRIHRSVDGGMIWAFMEGDHITGHAPGVYRSDAEGETWTPCAASPFVQLRTVPADAFKVERDLTLIVNYQHKNGSGTGQLLGLDTAMPDLIYVGEWTTGLYRSKDGGHSWGT
ncbi:MAG: hypothetical protein MSD82_10860 [Prevotella sp.]|nr:hypothetical protein [Prevotella sp.]